jgi:predicted RNA binding protein YcfA (HicA-like mRNA interferase family)
MNEVVIINFNEVEKILRKDGWNLVRVAGSHHHYKHPHKKGLVTIPKHKGDLKLNTLKSIFKQAEIKNYK